MTARPRALLGRTLAGWLGSVLVGCGPSAGGDSQTNWLRVCQTDAQCGELRCLCGACTRPCTADTACAGVSGSSCVPATDAGAIALCGGNTAPSGLCLPRCADGRCASGTACVAGVCEPIPEPTAEVTVDIATRYQTLLGLGAKIASSSDAVVQHPQKATLYRSMFADLGLDVLRLNNRYAENNAAAIAHQAEVAMAAATSLGRKPTLMITSGTPPANLKANGARTCAGNPDTCTLVKLTDGTFDYAGLGAYWRASLDAYASAGVAPDYLGIQNNPDWVPEASDTREACRFLPTEGSATVVVGGVSVEVTYPGIVQAVTAVRGQLAGLASIPKIVAPEVAGVSSVGEYAPYLDFSQVDAISHHLYGIDPAAIDPAQLATLGELGRQYQRPLFQDEMQADGFGTAVLMHYALVVEGASAYLQNDIVASAPTGATPTVSITLGTDDFTLEPPYFAIRHYALRTDPGWTRVAASSSVKDLLASAWLSPGGDALTVVVVNAGLTELDAKLDASLQTSITTEVTRTCFAGVERFANLGTLSAERVLRVPGHCMVTVAWRR